MARLPPVSIVERPEARKGSLQGIVKVIDSGISSSIERETDDVTGRTAPSDTGEEHATSTMPLPRDPSPWSMEALAPMPPV